MEETQKFLEPTPVDTDATLATPRFDEVEAQVARPVVPLSEAPAVVRSRRGPRGRWPIALVLISALAGGVVSLLAFRLYQQQSQAVAAEAVDQTAETKDAGQEMPSPTPAGQSPTAATEEQAQADAPLVFEEFDPEKEGEVATPRRAEGEGATVVKPAATAPPRPEEGRVEAKPAPRAAEVRPRRAEGSPVAATAAPPRQYEVRHEDVLRADQRRDDDGDRLEDRRERRRQRREDRREGRRGRGRNIDRIKDIFEGPPPA